MKNYLNVVDCAIEFNQKYLVIERPQGRHAGGLLSFPGGKVDPQDEIENQDILVQAVKREILEEVGIKLIDPLKYITSNFFVGDNGRHVIRILFHCILTEQPILNVSNFEVKRAECMSYEEINQMPNAPAWFKNDVNLIHAKGYFKLNFSL